MDLLKPLIALLAIVNPIGVVPFFLAFTLNFSREQRRRTGQEAAHPRRELAKEGLRRQRQRVLQESLCLRHKNRIT